MIARLGGDEFAVLLENVDGEEGAIAAAQHLLEALVPPARLGDYEIVVTASIGICLYPDHGETAEEILQRADKAMYRAKLNGRDGFELFSDENEESRSGVLERLRFESGIRNALERDEYVVFYQPQMTMDRRSLLAVEALVRWNHPQLGLVPPSRFMPFLEATGLIKSVGAWVLETAAAEVRSWQLHGFPDLRLTVNLSARQFEGTDLVDGIVRTLEATGFPPTHLELEITESLLMRDIDRTRAILEELKNIRDPHRHRRLRDRILVARLPHEVSPRLPEDRSVVRPRHRDRRRRPRRRRGNHRPRPQPPPGRRGRGCRDRAAAFTPSRLRRVPGLPHRPPAGSERNPGAPGALSSLKKRGTTQRRRAQRTAEKENFSESPLCASAFDPLLPLVGEAIPEAENLRGYLRPGVLPRLSPSSSGTSSGCRSESGSSRPRLRARSGTARLRPRLDS